MTKNSAIPDDVDDDFGCTQCGDAENAELSERDDEICVVCSDAGLAADVLDEFAAGRIADARDLLNALASESSGAVADLIREAQDCARRADWDECAHRLRLITQPKFKSMDECRARYETAMVVRRGGTA